MHKTQPPDNVQALHARQEGMRTAARSGEGRGSHPSLTTGSPGYSASALQQNSGADISPSQACEAGRVTSRSRLSRWFSALQSSGPERAPTGLP